MQNTGWLPSYVSKRALERKVVRGVIAEIALPAGAALVQGKRREEIGQLEGKSDKHTGVSFWPDYNVTDDRAKVEWIVRGSEAIAVQLSARHDRAGTVRAKVTFALNAQRCHATGRSRLTQEQKRMDVRRMEVVERRPRAAAVLGAAGRRAARRRRRAQAGPRGRSSTSS